MEECKHERDMNRTTHANRTAENDIYIDGWMKGWMQGWRDAWMDAWMHGRIDTQAYG